MVQTHTDQEGHTAPVLPVSYKSVFAYIVHIILYIVMMCMYMYACNFISIKCPVYPLADISNDLLCGN